jgi:hypothetical protein
MSNLFGVLAEFDSPKSLFHAAEKVRDAGYSKWDTFSPFPVHGMDRAMGLKESILGWIVAIGGATGLLVGFGLQTWVATTAYKIIVSGKPLFSYQAFIPVTFELMVLFSAFSAVFGMFILNRLPQHYHPLFNNPRFSTATSHGFFIAIEAIDPKFNQSDVEQFMKSSGAIHTEIVEDK